MLPTLFNHEARVDVADVEGQASELCTWGEVPGVLFRESSWAISDRDHRTVRHILLYPKPQPPIRTAPGVLWIWNFWGPQGGWF